MRIELTTQKKLIWNASMVPTKLVMVETKILENFLDWKEKR